VAFNFFKDLPKSIDKLVNLHQLNCYHNQLTVPTIPWEALIFLTSLPNSTPVHHSHRQLFSTNQEIAVDTADTLLTDSLSTSTTPNGVNENGNIKLMQKEKVGIRGALELIDFGENRGLVAAEIPQIFVDYIAFELRDGELMRKASLLSFKIGSFGYAPCRAKNIGNLYRCTF